MVFILDVKLLILQHLIESSTLGGEEIVFHLGLPDWKAGTQEEAAMYSHKKARYEYVLYSINVILLTQKKG